MRAWLLVCLACVAMFACGTASAQTKLYCVNSTTPASGGPCYSTLQETIGPAEASYWATHAASPGGPYPQIWWEKCGPGCASGNTDPVLVDGAIGAPWSHTQNVVCRSKSSASASTQTCGTSRYLAQGYVRAGPCNGNKIWVTETNSCACAPDTVDPDGDDICTPADPNGDLPSCGNVGDDLGGDSTSKYTIGANSTVACYRGCLAAPQWQYGQGENRWATGPWTSMGAPCEGDGSDGKPPELPKDEPATSCGTGRCPGQVNGVDVCVPCGTTSSTEVTNTTGKDANGNDVPGPTTTTTATDNGDGSVTVKTVVVNPDGSTTTTTTTRPKDGVDADGQTGGDGDDGEAPVPFCTENPDSPICKVGTFGGSCSGSFTCQGDAVQCAMAREQHERNCQLYDKPNSLTAYAETISDALQGPEHPASAPRQVNVAGSLTVDRTDLGCPVNTEVTLMGKTVVIPWANTCNGLRFMGDIAFALSLISAIIFLMRKVGS